MFNRPQTRKTFCPVTLPAIPAIAVPEQTIYLKTTGGIWPGELTRPIQELIKKNAAAEAVRQAEGMHGVNLLTKHVAEREQLSISAAREKMFPEAAVKVKVEDEDGNASETEVVSNDGSTIFNYAETLEDMKAIIQPNIPDDCKPDLMELQRAIASMILSSRLASTIEAECSVGGTVLNVKSDLFFPVVVGDKIEFKTGDRYITVIVAEAAEAWATKIKIQSALESVSGLGFLLDQNGKQKSRYDWTEQDTDTLTSQRLAVLYEFFMREKAGILHPALSTKKDEGEVFDSVLENQEVFDSTEEAREKSSPSSTLEPQPTSSNGPTSSNDAAVMEPAIAA